MSVLADIVGAVVAAVALCPPVTDDSSPAAFTQETDLPIEKSELDRGYMVETGLPTVLNYINLPGKVTLRVPVKVHVAYTDELRGDGAAMLLIAQDSEHLSEYLFFAVRNASVAGLNSWDHDGDASVVKSGDVSRRILTVPFVAVYYDDAVTS